MKRYKRLFKEISIPKNTLYTIGKYTKDKKYVTNSSILKVSFEDLLKIRIDLEKELSKNPSNIELKKAINELNKV